MSPKAPKKTFSDLKAAAQKGLANIDVDALKDKAAGATSIMVEKAGELKDAAVDVKDDIAAKLTELDRMLQESVTEYNDAYTTLQITVRRITSGATAFTSSFALITTAG